VFRRLAALGVVLSLTCVMLVSAAAGNKPKPDQLISEIGTYRLYHGKLTMRFYEDKGKLNYRFVTTQSVRVSLFRRDVQTTSFGPAEPWIEKGSNWFAFAETHTGNSPKALWIFNGRDLLVQIAFSPGVYASQPGQGFFGLYDGVERHSDSKPEMTKEAPKAVLDRLPESFKRKLEGESQIAKKDKG
jgi:hypothetical protein